MQKAWIFGWLAMAAVTGAMGGATGLAAQERGAIPEYRTFGAAPSQADAQALEELFDAYRSAWSRQDAQALAALHTPDTEWTNAFARIIQGSDALQAFLGNRMFPGFPRQVSEAEAESLTPISLRYVGDDVAVWHIYAESRRNGDRDNPQEARRVHFHFVIEKGADNAWRIAHTAIFDARR
ncbi:MAG: SgcJ/EcaC family oxidoreductase [Pseudomonadota bacterium]